MKVYAVISMQGFYGDLEVYDIHDTLEKALESIKQKKERDKWHVVEFMLNEKNDDGCYTRLISPNPLQVELKETNTVVDLRFLED